MRHRLSLIPLLLTLCVVALSGVPASASAAESGIYTDCNDGTLDQKYTTKQLQDALRDLEANVSEYQECSDAIAVALYGGVDGSSKGGSGGGTTGGGGSNGGTGGSTTGGTAQGVTPSTGGSTATGSAAPTTTATDSRLNDARDADAAEQAAAQKLAEQANATAGKQAADLRDIGIPAAALQLGASETSLPTPLLLTLVACGLAACIAGGATGVQALRRRRGR